MQLGRGIRGGRGADTFTRAVSFSMDAEWGDHISMAWLFALQTACWTCKSSGAMLVALAPRYGMMKRRGCQHSQCWRTPMADKSNDPVAVWQNMIGEMEKGFNA